MTVETLDVIEQAERLRIEQAGVSGNIAELQGRLGALEADRKALLAAGTNVADKKFDAIDLQKLRIAREIEALQMKLSEIQGERDALAPQVNETLNQRRETNARQAMEAYLAEAMKLVRNQIAHWRAGCRASYDLSNVLAKAQRDPSISERQKADILTQCAYEIDSTRSAVWNEHWTPKVHSAGGWTLATIPSAPPDSLRHLEEIR